MSATTALTADLRKQVLVLEDDLRARVQADPSTRDAWMVEHKRAVNRGRTAASWVAWRDDRVTQAAVAWVLATVFVRFCEDNALVGPVWIAGPAARRQEALDGQLAFFRTHPEETDREWLLQAIERLRSLPATAGLVEEHSPLWLVAPSGDAASALLAFWRQRGDDGELVHDLTDLELDTRFLGDLYQELSEHAKSAYALLQTPVFVEEFILDHTLEPALLEGPLAGFRMIDPTCGSGHFLLGGFARLLDRWHREAPGMEVQALVQAALDAVHGVDLNPFAVAIARFRLIVAALQACGSRSLEAAPAFTLHLAVGDSLLHGPGQQTLDEDVDLSGFAYSTEDLTLLREILTGGRYDVVVGNPPYITARDRSLNRAYREAFFTCHGTYTLTIPFTERLFQLAQSGDVGGKAGWIGQITSSSFMNCDYGTKLVKEFLPTKDIQLVVNSEGAWIPGHNMEGTPTLIMFGRNRAPVKPSVRVVLSKGRRESSGVGDLGGGPYWRSIVEQVSTRSVPWENDWISIEDFDRTRLGSHPWSLVGGGANELMDVLSAATSRTVASVVAAPIGRAIRAGADEAFVRPKTWRQTTTRLPNRLMPFMRGEDVRNWRAEPGVLIYYPYVHGTGERFDGGLSRELWPYRAVLDSRGTFQGTMADAGRAWWEYMQHTASAYETPLSITFAFKASHNHFALDRGGSVFNRHAPVIKLPADSSTEESYFPILGVLNSSVACFWMRQRAKPSGGASARPWSRTFEFTGAVVASIPVPDMSALAERTAAIVGICEGLARLVASIREESYIPTAESIRSKEEASDSLLARLVFQQEELDWEVYRAFGLVSDDVLTDPSSSGVLSSGQRAFEFGLATESGLSESDQAWFVAQGATPSPEFPDAWTEPYRAVVKRRVELIRHGLHLRLLERPDCKRPWNGGSSWNELQSMALRDWLIGRVDRAAQWHDAQGRPRPRSISQLADELGRDSDFVHVLSLWAGVSDPPVSQTLHSLLVDQAVPYLAAYRYSSAGLRKREEWERIWEIQRRSEGEDTSQDWSRPPDYVEADYRRSTFWSLRGKLDVPKERFIAYPDAGRETDPTPLLGWAGWDHAQQSLTLSVIIAAREADGWSDERLVPLVAGLAELQPWVEQWHADLNPAYGVSLAAFCREQLTARAAQVNKTTAELAAWRPEPTTRGRKARS